MEIKRMFENGNYDETILNDVCLLIIYQSEIKASLQNTITYYIVNNYI